MTRIWSLLLLAPSIATAEPFALTASSTTGAGSIVSSGSMTLGATAGQPAAAGLMAPNGMVLQSGFWSVALAAPTTLAIVQQPQSQTVSLGAGATLAVSATGMAPLRYQWRHNGFTLDDATNATLVISNAQVQDGGAYEVTVYNDDGAVVSETALLSLNITFVAPGDDFVDRVILPGSASGNIAGTTLNYTRESGEPFHFGKPGSASGWYSWTAPVTGIITLDTRGSTFDTLLAVYKGTSLLTLTEAASDDDSAGFHASEVRFNVSSGMTYQIAIDGLGFDSGEFVLSWLLEATQEALPLILTQPVSQTVLPASNAMFTVTAMGVGLQYQWLFNGSIIASATSSNLFLVGVAETNVGFYTAQIANAQGRVVTSLPAVLELGPISSVRTVDKIEDLPPVGGPLQGHASSSNPLQSSVSGLVGSFSVSAGTILDPQTFTANGTANLGEPAHCGVGAKESVWIQVIATSAGLCEIDTEGSNYDTVLAVYKATGISVQMPYSYPVACNNNAVPGHTHSRVQFLATQGVTYRVVVDRAVNSPRPTQRVGKFRVRMHDLNGLVIDGPVSHLKWIGSQAKLIHQPPGAPGSYTYQWLRDDLPIPGANANIVELGPLQFSDAGAYALRRQNTQGTVTNAVALLSVVTVVREEYTQDIQFWVQASRPLVLEGKGTLHTNVPWAKIADIVPSTAPILYHSAPPQPRFFRAGPP